MNQTDLYPEILRPYDPRHTPLPPPTQDVCEGPVVNICMNVNWWSHVSGMIARLIYRDAWEGSEDEIDRAIESVYKILNVGEPTMSCGCGCKGQPNRTRFTDDGAYEVSYDGGETWEDGKDFDPRYTSPAFPPAPGDPGAAKRCSAANSVVVLIKDKVETWKGYLETGGIFVDFALACIGALVVGIFAPVAVPFIFGVCLTLLRALWDGGAEAYGLAFSDSVYNDLLCILYCHVSDDGTFDDAAIAAIISDCASKFDPIPRDAFTVAFKGWGALGTTNAASIGGGGLDCDDCNCNDGTCPVEWQVVTGYGDVFGTIISQDETQVTVQTTNVNTNGVYYCYLWSGSPSACCYMNSWEVVSGGTVNLSVGDCGSSLLDVHGGLIGEGCYNQFQPQSNAPFTVKFNLTACP